MTPSVTLPRFRSALIAIALALTTAAPLGGLAPVVARADSLAAPLEAVMAQETVAIDLLNADRVAHGLAPLEFDPGLATVARWRSEDMAARGYFSHDIGGYQVFQVLQDQGISYRVAGENLAYNYYGAEETAARAEHALMNSPSHRDNILRPDYTHVGIGVAVAPDGRFLFTQLFKRAF